MASSQTLAILAQVVDRLKPLGDRSRGDPLRAEDWNQVVGAIADLAGLVATREESADALLQQRFAPASHDHAGAARIAWFDGPTQALLERAANGSVAQGQALARLEKRIADLAAELKGLAAQVNGVRLNVDSVRDRDVEREQALLRTRLDLESVRAVETRVTGLANELGSFDASRRQILAFRESLQDASGAPIDLAALGSRVAELDDLRGRLTLANGELADLRALESQIARLERRGGGAAGGAAGAAGDVRDTVTGLLADPAVFDFSMLEERLVRPMRETLEAQLAALDGRVASATTALDSTRSDLAASIGQVGRRVDTLATVDTRVEALAERLAASEAVANSARADAAAIPALSRDLSRLSQQTERLASQQASMATTLDGRISALQGEIGAVRQAVEPNGALDARLRDLGARLDAVADTPARLDRLTGDLAAQNALLAGVRAETAQLAASAQTVARVEEALITLQRSRAATDQQLQTVLQRQSAIDQRIEGLGQRIAPLAAEVASLRTVSERIGTINASVERLNGRVFR